MKVQERLSRLLLTSREEIITIASDIKRIPNFIHYEDGRVKRQFQIEISDGKDYTKEEIKKMYNGNKLISRWEHILDDGIEKLVIVIE